MTIFRKLFPPKTKTDPVIRFGRFSDAYHTSRQDEAFDRAVQFFEQGSYLKAYLAFFNYLKNEEADNVQVWEEEGRILFSLFQGSKLVTGYGDAQKLHATARVARATRLNAGFMLRLLEENYELRYSRFVLTPDNEIAIVFQSYTSDGSPYKLYEALKELATYADKHDDLLVDEFEELKPVDPQVKKMIPETEKEIKYHYLVHEIRSVLDEIRHGTLDANQYPAGISYLLLYLCCKLDYLIVPQGHTMEALERIHRIAFSGDGKSVAVKNEILIEEFIRLLDRPREKFFEEMYEVRATFGITAPIDHHKVALIIGQELPNMKWYHENGYEKVALSIPGFIAARCLFYYAVPEPDQAFFHLLLRVLENSFFTELGYPSFVRKGKPDEKAIKRKIKLIVETFRPDYPSLNPDSGMLRFDSLCHFSSTFCRMVQSLNTTKRINP